MNHSMGARAKHLTEGSAVSKHLATGHDYPASEGRFKVPDMLGSLRNVLILPRSETKIIPSLPLHINKFQSLKRVVVKRAELQHRGCQFDSSMCHF